MKYALGNMLNGAGGLNPDGLSLDLQFAADKTLTARKGPTPTFARASTATFVGSDGLIQSVAINAARFDHNPVSLACKGLLIEESRTNNCYNSNLLTSASWSFVGATSATSDTAPDGSSAFEITETLAVSGHNTSNSGGATSTPATSITSGVIYTLSVFAKKSTDSVDWIQLTGTGPAFGTAQYANFNLATGAIGNYTGVTSGTVPKIEQFPNGWYRCSMTVTATATAVGNSISINLTNNTNTTTRGPSYLGSTANKVKLAMGQFEAGSFATSYIPNVGSSGVIRSADVCSITAGAFSGMYNQPEGTLFADVTPQVVDQGVSVLTVNTTTFNNSHSILKTNSTASAPGLRWAGSTFTSGIVSNIVTSTDVATTRARLAYAYKLNDMAFAASGLLIGTDTSGTMPSPTAMHIGMRDSSVQINGHLASVRYFRKRLSNAKLQTLTT